jgi:hypothetical protein
MRRSYEDPGHHLDRHLQDAAERYVDGLQRTGLQPNDRLTHAIAERTVREAGEHYVQEATDVRDHNIAMSLREHHERLNAIKREGALLRLKMCPPMALVFTLMAWYSFGHSGGLLMTICYGVGALAFLAMLVLGAIFDPPREFRSYRDFVMGPRSRK